MSKIVTASKLNRLWKNGVLPIKDKVDDLEENGSSTVVNKLSSYDDVMANTVEGYIPDALAVKEGFTQVNDSLGEIRQTTTSIEIDSLVSLSYGGFMLKKFGNVVMLSNNGTYIKPSSDITADTIMCNIPEEYRPSTTLVLISYHGYSSKNYPMLISISPNGNVAFTPIDYSGNSMSSSLYWQGYITWIVD